MILKNSQHLCKSGDSSDDVLGGADESTGALEVNSETVMSASDVFCTTDVESSIS